MKSSIPENEFLTGKALPFRIGIIDYNPSFIASTISEEPAITGKFS